MTLQNREARSSLGGTLVSIIVPIYKPRKSDLLDCLRSIVSQSHSNIELLCIEDCSEDDSVQSLVFDFLAHRIRVHFEKLDGQNGISFTTQRGLEEASGDFVLLVDQDDVLSSNAVEALLGGSAGADVIYADEGKIDQDGYLGHVSFKPCESPTLLEQCNYINHPLMIRRAVLLDVGGFNSSFDGAQDHELLLRLSRFGSRFSYVPEVLYYWRESPGSVASNAKNKRWAFEAGKRAIEAHLLATGKTFRVVETKHDGRFALVSAPAPPNCVSVIIPTAGFWGTVRGERTRFIDLCLRSLSLAASTIKEVVVVYDTHFDHSWLSTLPEISGVEIKKISFDGEFNFSSKVNLGREHSSAEYLLILNDDTELIEPKSLDAMVARASENGVGAVGAKLLHEDGSIQHAGQALSPSPHHPFAGYPGTSTGPGDLIPLILEREVSGVTGAALLCRREVFDAAGGFNPSFSNNYNDVDFCLRIRSSGKRVIWTPHAVWTHFESRSRDARVRFEELEQLRRTWPGVFTVDPYLYPNGHQPVVGLEASLGGKLGDVLRFGSRLLGPSRKAQAVRLKVKRILFG